MLSTSRYPGIRLEALEGSTEDKRRRKFLLPCSALAIRSTGRARGACLALTSRAPTTGTRRGSLQPHRGHNCVRDQRQKESRMTVVQRLSYLRVALLIVGIACLALYPLMLFWPSGWTWHVGHSDYPMMIVGIYATLGVFLLLAVRNPLAHLSLIWFTVWSSVVHGAIMAVQALTEPGHTGHHVGDVPALIIAAVALAALTPRNQEAIKPLGEGRSRGR